MQNGKFSPELVSPCGMNCGICISFFGYSLNGKKRKHPGLAVDQRENNAHSLKSNATNWQQNKLCIVLNAQIFHVKT
jgi:hypothetical protein